MTTIALGGDHAGYHYKKALISRLENLGYTYIDFGPYDDTSVDYPDFVHPVAEAISTQKATLGILICGSANGVAITANKHPNIRAAICWRPDLAQLARQHNDANIICLPARFISLQDAQEILRIFLSTPFEGGRHEARVAKIPLKK